MLQKKKTGFETVGDAHYPPEPDDDQKVLRITFNPSEDSIKQRPSSPMSGRRLPVFGISGAGAGASAGGGAATATRIG